MSDHDTDHIASIIPERDEPPGYQRQSATRQTKNSTGGAGLLARLFIAVALVAGAVACAWAFQLQEQVQKADQLLFEYQARIKDLEDRLSDTDESVSQSSVTMQVKIKELYSEVDKLWASAWRRNKADIASTKKAVATNAANLKNYKKIADANASSVKAHEQKIVALNKIAGSIAQVTENQRQLEKLGDQLYKLNLDSAQLNKRVTTNEEWVESINGFRKQVNRNMNTLQQSIGALQGDQFIQP